MTSQSTRTTTQSLVLPEGTFHVEIPTLSGESRVATLRWIAHQLDEAAARPVEMDPPPPRCMPERSALLTPVQRERYERNRAWRQAEIQMEYHEAFLRFLRAERMLQDRYDDDQGRDRQAVGRYRSAIAAQLLAPAPTRAAVAWKKRAAKQYGLPVSPERIAAAIAEDERWLATNPFRRRRSEKSQVEAHVRDAVVSVERVVPRCVPALAPAG